MAEPGQERETVVLEEGDIFFLYRPRVEEEHPSSIGDVQRFEMVLRPHGGEKVRLLVVGRKRLPEAERHERHWGFVEAIRHSAKGIEKELRERRYDTGTRGERRRPAARPAGEGVYAITLEDGQMHLSYALELPEKPGQVQKAFKIAPEASYALSIKNPEKGKPVNAGLREEDEADYPEKLQEEFRGRRFAREDVGLLDFKGAEFILIGARSNPESEYGHDLGAEHENYEHAETIRRLRMVKSRHPVKPLLEGGWA
ncbi:hypothetical protein [Sinorhizobium psoraleae]|uniref:Uncharacterized protein n=1 Tax=Sinorhizobium psoraleae TaxID=520838 RepID=A0ABT4KEQ2_9HYPH|nr:hypothetical protein [Sinorhizobium psoraleae]MCZ4090445.1 hypothetical protein [Sinorhizobium psoraleae]